MKALTVRMLNTDGQWEVAPRAIRRLSRNVSATQIGESNPKIWVAGSVSALEAETTAFFCSSQCPGSVILKTFDAITAMRDEGRTLIGGFHSPMEWECLGILLRGRQPVIWVPARSIVGMHLRPELQPAFTAGRLLIMSPFESEYKRVTAALASERNRFVGALADNIFVAHAAPASRTLMLCMALRESGKPLLTVDDAANEPLLGFATKVRSQQSSPTESTL